MSRLTHVVALLLLALGGVLAAPAVVAAQEFVIEEAPEAAPEESGWSGRLSLSGNFSLTHNNRVVGQSDGTTIALGTNVNGRLSFARNGHSLRNTLRASQTFSRTPTIPELVKTADELRIESLYLYHFPEVDWIGPFTRAQLNTALFHGFDVRPDDVAYSLDGDTVAIDDRIRLTNALRPLTLRESVGAFVRPSNDPMIRSMLRLGVGARQVFADGQLVVADDEETPDIIELAELRSFNQIGAEAVLEATGEFEGGNVTYSIEAETLIPFYNSLANDDRSAIDLANVEVAATLSFRLVTWASLDYQFRAARIPALVEDWQVSNNLLLSLSWAAGFGEE
ncbi:MAG: hypothetical protein EA398_05475 [Deltaproteobacteria bacterium]|nr:MAG: hypothetical protein EA398_05475 [Deltaproteobacteria bacterium]